MQRIWKADTNKGNKIFITEWSAVSLCSTFLWNEMKEITLANTLVGHQNPIYTLAIDSLKGLLYSAGNDKGIVEWDLSTSSFKRVLCTVPASVYTLCVLAEKDLLVAGMRNGEVLVIKKTQPELFAKLKVDKGAVFSIQYLEKKNELIAIGEEGKAYVWNADSFELLYTFKISKETVRSIAINEAQNYIAFGDKDGFVYIHDSNDFHQVASQKIHEMSVTNLDFVGDTLLSGGRDAKLYKLEVPTLQESLSIVPHMFTVYGIKQVGDKGNFVTISRDKTIKLWNSDLKLVKNVSRDKGIDSHHLSINSLAFDKERKLLATGGDDKIVKIWQLS